MFSGKKPCIYRNNQLGEVICQLRFPEILKISAQPPVNFQEAIRNDFPRYSSRKDMSVPKMEGMPGNMNFQAGEPIISHQFASEDGYWRVKLTGRSLTLACSRYTCWEDFARQLDKPLAAFIQTYQPAYFERINLRYVNFFSRTSLGLEGVPFRDLIQPCYLGPLMHEDVLEQGISRCSVDVDTATRGGNRVQIHAGPGIVKKNGQMDRELKFVFDQDVYMPNRVPVNLSAGTLQSLHTQAESIFRGAITDTLHNAMDPIHP